MLLRFWRLVRNGTRREMLSWLGAAVVGVVCAWILSTYFFPRDDAQKRLSDQLERFVAQVARDKQTRERAPLDWARTQNNLGNVLLALGAREGGTARLEEAVAAYREALKERTRERVAMRATKSRSKATVSTWTRSESGG
jgi:16S rRNA G1207 methylase RsmC